MTHTHSHSVTAKQFDLRAALAIDGVGAIVLTPEQVSQFACCHHVPVVALPIKARPVDDFGTEREVLLIAQVTHLAALVASIAHAVAKLPAGDVLQYTAEYLNVSATLNAIDPV